MRTLAHIVIGFLVVTLGWYGAWRWIMADDVARISSSMEYHNQQFKSVNRQVVLKHDAAYPYGFPFKFQVKVDRPTLSMVLGRETYAVSLPSVILTPTDSAQGRYRVELPQQFEALYAADGQAPENYRVTLSTIPDVSLRAQGNSLQCSGFPGAKACGAVAADAPVISYATSLPPSIVLHMELNGKTRDAQFTLMPLSVPVFMDIPKTVAYPLELFVNILREALVHRQDQ